MKINIPYLLCLICTIMAFVILGINLFAVYQLLPIAIFLIFHKKVFLASKGRYLTFCHQLTILAFLLYPLTMQLAWRLDLYHIATESSTSGLLFVYLPIYAVSLGLISALIGAILKKHQRSRG